jgi:hypothetical protein
VALDVQREGGGGETPNEPTTPRGNFLSIPIHDIHFLFLFLILI